jgi:hypothetical protein
MHIKIVAVEAVWLQQRRAFIAGHGRVAAAKLLGIREVRGLDLANSATRKAATSFSKRDGQKERLSGFPSWQENSRG